jgi:hypothetical protein
MHMPESSAAPIRWSAYEHEHTERTSDWFWALGIITVCAALTSILFGNVLFALLIVVAATVLALLARTPPELHEFELSEKGIRTAGVLHKYDEILSFWVETEGTAPLLLVDTTKLMSPNLIIPLGDADPAEVRTFLRERVEEVPMKEPFSHKILEFFGL